MWMILYYLFCYLIFGYTMAIMASYMFMIYQSSRAQRALAIEMPDDETIKYQMRGSPLTPAVSIIAPAFNEEVTIIDNVHSLMQIDYPDYEIIIINDASTDRTMELLIENYELVEVPYDIAMRVPCKPIKRVLKSTNPKFSKLVVVDKEHGGRKSDGSNAGINVCSNKYFVCTDVDCIIEPMALYRMMWLVINSHHPMIGVGATMLMNNGCVISDGSVVEAREPSRILPLFQLMEYLRSYLVGKLGWASFNALPNISGGFGLFDTDVVVKSGGYDQTSMAEDMDMLLRMVTYMKNSGQKFNVAQVPQVCCWTEGPSTMRAFYRQRTRWARGLFEIVSHHRKLFFNAHYGPIGAVTLSYIFMFEFIAPVLEMIGILFTIWMVIIGGVNWEKALIIFCMVYLFAVLMALCVLAFDYSTNAVNWFNRKRTYRAICSLTLSERRSSV